MTPETTSHDHIDLVGFHAADLPLACLYWDNRRHQFLLWIPNRLQEKPLEVGRCAGLFLWPLQISHEGVAAISRTVAPLAEPPTPMMDESNTAIAIWIWAFHDTFLARFFVTLYAAPPKHCVSQ
jgi:hypothetical protein